ncbi:cytosine permease [Aneurinibacillus migulanus]|uniref:cytosine permease n=2 Tax=Aneurinibacillus migulanus TaxID=47500 RepID=UPI002E160DB8|nr:cytosine permease [Aneurinibacillus migulanus]
MIESKNNSIMNKTLYFSLFIPVIAVFLVDYYILKKSRYYAEESISGERKVYWYQGGVNLFAYIAYLGGALFAYYFTYVQPLVENKQDNVIAKQVEYKDTGEAK